MTQWMAAAVSPPPVTTHTAPAPVLGCVMARPTHAARGGGARLGWAAVTITTPPPPLQAAFHPDKAEHYLPVDIGQSHLDTSRAEITQEI